MTPEEMMQLGLPVTGGVGDPGAMPGMLPQQPVMGPQGPMGPQGFKKPPQMPPWGGAPGGPAAAATMPPTGAGPGGPPGGAPPQVAQGGPPRQQSDSPWANPAFQKSMLGAQQFAPEEAQAQRQYALADKLRGQIPGMTKSSSPISTPNWMGAIAGIAGGLRANQLEGKADAAGKDIAGRRSKLYEQYFNEQGAKRDPEADGPLRLG